MGIVARAINRIKDRKQPTISAQSGAITPTPNRREPRIETDRSKRAEPIKNESKNSGEGVNSEDKGSALLKKLTFGLTFVGGEDLRTQVTGSKQVSFSPDEPVAE
ncbi:unnamed protein product [Arctogadus glacialis]